MLLHRTSPCIPSNPVPRAPREISASAITPKSVNKEERGSLSRNIFLDQEERSALLTKRKGREGKAADISVREETRSRVMLWAVQENLSSPTAAHCPSGLRHPLLPQHQTLLSLLAKLHVKHDEPATLKDVNYS